MDDDKWHVHRVVLVPDSFQGDSIHPGHVGAHNLVDSVPDEQTFASHRVSLDFGGVRPQDRVRKVEDGKVEPNKDDSTDGSTGVGFSSLGIDYATLSAYLIISFRKEVAYLVAQSPTRQTNSKGQTQSKIVFLPTFRPRATAAICENQVKTFRPA